MNRERRAGGLALVLLGASPLLGSCSSTEQGPPAIVLDETPCAHCRMLVSDVAFAAAFRTSEGEERVFDDIDCMLRELPAEGARIWVRDFDTSEWIEGEKATFLRSESIQTPMGGGIVAFASREQADRYAGEVLSLAELQGGM